MKENRKVERFELHIETLCNVQEKEISDKTPMLLTKNISSSGAYLTTNKPLPVGTDIDLSFVLSQHELSNETRNKKVKIRTSGRVIRTDNGGMAVEFENQYKVSQFE